MTTWGDIYCQHLAKGEDHGSAAYAADQWEKRETQKAERLKTEQIERAVLKRHGIL